MQSKFAEGQQARTLHAELHRWRFVRAFLAERGRGLVNGLVGIHAAGSGAGWMMDSMASAAVRSSINVQP